LHFDARFMHRLSYSVVGPARHLRSILFDQQAHFDLMVRLRTTLLEGVDRSELDQS
jgi:hypothetical protein